jgi:uncharacterized protein (DUF433 family)
MTTGIDIGTLIVRTPGTGGGRPRIARTRITVENIAIDFKAGWTPEVIVQKRTHLNLAQVYAALAYYYANKKQIDAEIAAENAEWERLEADSMAGKLS